MVNSKSKLSLSCKQEPVKQQALSAQEKRFHKLGLFRLANFVVHLPLRYEDETRIHSLNSLKPGNVVQVEGNIHQVQVQYRPSRRLSAVLHNTSGSINLRWLHFYPSQVQQLESGKILRAMGEVRPGFNGLEIIHPRITVAGKPLPTTLTPVYPTTKGLSQAALRNAIQQALDKANLSDTLPEQIINDHNLVPFAQAIRTLHSPPANACYESLINHTHEAWQRIKFDELLAQQLALHQARLAREQVLGPKLNKVTNSITSKLIKSLPFKLTNAQKKVLAEIKTDLSKSYPMNRLLQGDVGSGKTIVAALAALQVIECGHQVAIMAPTELLAEQHYEKMLQWMEPLGIKLALLTGHIKASEKRERLSLIADGTIQLVVGTQALIQDHVIFATMGLAILDEQHRFGVGQRLDLNRKGYVSSNGQTHIPHQLSLSATPIPRTLAMTFLADLDVSVLNELPPGRTEVITKLVNNSRRNNIIDHVFKEVSEGRQCYWVCPLVEESEALQLQTAIDTYEQLVQEFTGLNVGLVHGRMSAAEKHQTMELFRNAQIQVLVSTTVIEVGVDVPNASIMVIEHAERFGLSQLHQLRGRVGRGSVSSICVLLYQTPLSQVAKDRLKAIYKTTDGFEIAREDLRIRGPGEFLGVRQSGQQLLRFANLDTDEYLIDQVRDVASLMLTKYPEYAERHIDRWMQGKYELLRT